MHLPPVLYDSLLVNQPKITTDRIHSAFYRVSILLFLSVRRNHSHSIVAGGLLVMSYATRFTPGTSATILLEIFPRTS